MSALKGFKLVLTLISQLKNIESEDKTKYDTFYSNSKAEIVINDSGIMFKSIYTIVISKIPKSLGESSDENFIDPVIDHNISISKYNPLAGSSYIELPKELNHPKKGLINTQNVDDREYFK